MQENLERTCFVEVKNMQQMQRGKLLISLCGNTFWRNTQDRWQHHFLNTLAWPEQEYFSNHREEKPTKESEFRIWILIQGWTRRMNLDKGQISQWGRWEEWECDQHAEISSWDVVGDQTIKTREEVPPDPHPSCKPAGGRRWGWQTWQVEPGGSWRSEEPI